MVAARTATNEMYLITICPPTHFFPCGLIINDDDDVYFMCFSSVILHCIGCCVRNYTIISTSGSRDGRRLLQELIKGVLA